MQINVLLKSWSQWSNVRSFCYYFPCYLLCFALSITECSRVLYNKPRMWKMMTEVVFCIHALKQAVVRCCHWCVNKSLSFNPIAVTYCKLVLISCRRSLQLLPRNILQQFCKTGCISVWISWLCFFPLPFQWLVCFSCHGQTINSSWLTETRKMETLSTLVRV